VLTPLAGFDYNNGAGPYGGLIQATNGSYYGVTSEGGDFGFGTVFEWSANGGLNTLFSFDGTNGGFSVASLTQGTDGNLYGVASDGGLANQGSVFQINTNGGLTTLLWFNGFNGSGPQSSLAQASNGIFYGATLWGGTGFDASSGGGNGTIFSITVPLFIHRTFTVTTAVAAVSYTAVITNQAVAPPGDALTFALVSGPAWLNVAGNGVLSGTPARANIGTNTFVVSLTDTNGVYVTAIMKVAVIADPPPTFLTNVIVGPSAGTGLAYSASISNEATTAYIHAGDVLTFGLVSGPAWLNASSNGLLSGTPAGANVGTNTFVVGVTNLGGGFATASLLIDVTNAALTPPAIVGGQLIFGSNGFQFSFTGPSGQAYTVLSSASLSVPLSQWQVVGSGTFGGTNVVFTDANAANNPFEYYDIKSP
jgi:uncharacterized repeat protein (TIGR03803 family)